MGDEGASIVEKYPHFDLTKQLIGLGFEAANRLGYGYQEKYYQRAFEELLKEKGISYKREQKAVINFSGRKIGRYFIDFVIGNKVVVELKVANQVYLQHQKQVLGYLKATGLEVGLLLLFTKRGVRMKRFINSGTAVQ